MSTPATPAPARVISSDQLGSCAICYTRIHRYGFGGNPLCASCFAKVDAGKKKATAAPQS
ncbi:hypothetical protein [Streptomyces violascens]|uniref:hypothetical protein n=1 Tax=Streptomyces violascens TaxID=67381 RepID=UPI0036869941